MSRLPLSLFASLVLLLLSPGTTHSQVEAAPEQAAPAASRNIEITVDGGFKPGRVVITEGERVRLTFVRREFTPCTKEVVFKSLELRRELPPDQKVTLELPPLTAGVYEFRCGMNMARGFLVVEPRQ